MKKHHSKSEMRRVESQTKLVKACLRCGAEEREVRRDKIFCSVYGTSYKKHYYGFMKEAMPLKVTLKQPEPQSQQDCWRCNVGEPKEFHVCESPKNPIYDTHFEISKVDDPNSWGKSQQGIIEFEQYLKSEMLVFSSILENYYKKDNPMASDAITKQDRLNQSYNNFVKMVDSLLHQQRELTIRECIQTLRKTQEEFQGSSAAYGLQKAILVLENLQSLINQNGKT